MYKSKTARKTGIESEKLWWDQDIKSNCKTACTGTHTTFFILQDTQNIKAKIFIIQGDNGLCIWSYKKAFSFEK